MEMRVKLDEVKFKLYEGVCQSFHGIQTWSIVQYISPYNTYLHYCKKKNSEDFSFRKNYPKIKSSAIFKRPKF